MSTPSVSNRSTPSSSTPRVEQSGSPQAPSTVTTPEQPPRNEVTFQSGFDPAKPQLVALNVPSGSGAPATTDAPTLRIGPGGTLVPTSTVSGAGPEAAAQTNAAMESEVSGQGPTGGPAMTPEEAFICQFTHETYNPNGPGSSSNCGPSSLAMSMAYMGKMPPGLSKEQQVDYARALMSPHRAAEFTYVNDANGNPVPQLDRDHELTSGVMEENGIRAAGGQPEYGQGWEALDRALENGPVISNGYTDATWRAQFPQRMGSGDVGHINTILGKTADGKYIVLDPLHTGGPVEMTREQLSKFYGPTGGEPSFVATNFGPTGSGTTPGTGTPTPGTGTPGTGGVTVPQTDLQYDGGTTYNPEVEKLQRALVQAGYLTQAELDTGPGYYGDRTRAAVARLQAKHGIADDGTHFGPQTRAALTRELSGSGTPGQVDGPGGIVDVGGIQLSAKDAETARRIDELLATDYPDSRMQGMGAVIVDASRKERIPVDLVLAQLAKESTFLRPDNNLSIANNNPGNLRFAEWERQFGGQPGEGNFTHFPSVEAGIRAYAHLLGMPLYRQDVDNRDWASLVSKYAPSSDGNDEALYVQQLHEWTAYFAGKIGVDFNWVNNP